MSSHPFDPDFKSDKPLFTARELGNRRAARKTSQRLQVVLDTNGPTRVPTADERRAARAKTANIQKASKL